MKYQFIFEFQSWGRCRPAGPGLALPRSAVVFSVAASCNVTALLLSLSLALLAGRKDAVSSHDCLEPTEKGGGAHSSWTGAPQGIWFLVCDERELQLQPQLSASVGEEWRNSDIVCRLGTLEARIQWSGWWRLRPGGCDQASLHYYYYRLQPRPSHQHHNNITSSLLGTIKKRTT